MGLIHSNQTFDIEKQREKLFQDVLKVEKEMKSLNDTKEKKEMEKQENNSNIEVGRGINLDENGYKLSELNWPDPDPVVNESKLFLDDVTRMNAKEVDRIFFVRCVDDIKHVLQLGMVSNKMSIRIIRYACAPSGGALAN